MRRFAEKSLNATCGTRLECVEASFDKRVSFLTLAGLSFEHVPVSCSISVVYININQMYVQGGRYFRRPGICVMLRQGARFFMLVQGAGFFMLGQGGALSLFMQHVHFLKSSKFTFSMGF